MAVSYTHLIAAEQPQRDNPLKHVEDTIEQNDNNFDGLINNTPQTPTVADFEQRADVYKRQDNAYVEFNLSDYDKKDSELIYYSSVEEAILNSPLNAEKMCIRDRLWLYRPADARSGAVPL